VAAPASSPLAAPASATVPTSSPASIAAPAASPVAAGIATEASHWAVLPPPPHLPSLPVSPPASSPVAAVTAPASVASSVPAFSSVSWIIHPSRARFPAEEDVLRLNTSNRDDDNWGFGGLSANSAIADGVNDSASLVHTGGTLLSFNVDNEVFPAALVLPNASTTATASSSATSVFSVATNYRGQHWQEEEEEWR
ncbi:hypothetical protein B0H14DRAFT_2625854, partial [Mycena olivaceomarginata]